MSTLTEAVTFLTDFRMTLFDRRQRGRTVTDPAHVAAAKALRQQYQRPRAADPHESLESGDELARDLAEYDRAFGLFDSGLQDAGDGQVA